jgi:hypothetical protein
MRFLNCSVCEEDGGVIKGAVTGSDQYPFLQFVLAIGLDDSVETLAPDDKDIIIIYILKVHVQIYISRQ